MTNFSSGYKKKKKDKIPLLVMYYLTKFEDIILNDFWVIPKITFGNLCKSILRWLRRVTFSINIVLLLKPIFFTSASFFLLPTVIFHFQLFYLLPTFFFLLLTFLFTSNFFILTFFLLLTYFFRRIFSLPIFFLLPTFFPAHRNGWYVLCGSVSRCYI